MTDQEYLIEQRRVRDYQAMTAVRSEIYAAIKAITEPWENGPHGQGPFTGNTRESRKVVSLAIEFSPTLGGAPATQISIRNINVSAWGFGIALKEQLNERLAAVNLAIEKL